MRLSLKLKYNRALKIGELCLQKLTVSFCDIIASMHLTSFLEPYCGRFISITGGGGKTSLLSLLGRYFRNQGKSVLLTTTTKLMSPRLHDYGQDIIFEDESVLGYRPEKGQTVFYAEHSTMDMKKWIAPREEVLTILSSMYDVVISEADGSRGLPFKIHTERDPVIHPSTTAVIAVAGLWGIGEKAYSAVFGSDEDVPVDRDYLERYVKMEEGISKGFIGNNAIVFNGAECVDSSVLDMLMSIVYPENTIVVAASEKEDKIIRIIA